MRGLKILAGMALLAVVGVFAYVWVSGGSGEPSTEVTAPALTTPASAASDPEISEDVSTTTATTPESTPSDPPEESTVVSSSDGGAAVVYRIDADSSSVTFEIDEILNGSPKRVVGVTSDVAGEVLIDFGNPSASVLGTTVINVRTLETDSSFRDRAMRGPILGSASDENEFAVFEPVSVDGLPEEVAIGETVKLVVTGDLTLSGTTKPVVFDIDVGLVSKERIEVTGAATVLRSDFGLQIPSVPSVSDVDDEIMLTVDLVAFAT